MSKPIVIAVHGEPQGVVVPNGGDFRFLAVKLGVFPLDGRVFASVAEARRAAKALVEGAGEMEGGEDVAEGDVRNGLVA